MKKFKIRSSATGQIVGLPKSEKDKEAGLLSAMAQTYCQNWVKEQLYNRKKEFSNKYTEKGLICEDNSIDFIAEQLKYGFLIKNEKYFENDYLTGTPDIVLPDLVIDVKNSWSWETFPLFEKQVSKSYYYQLQAYMELTGKNKAKLIYVLSNTPIHLIKKEAYYYAKDNGFEDLTKEIFEEFKAKMTYSDIQDNLKIKVFDIDKNNEAIELIKNSVIKCKNYIETLK